MKAVLIPQKKKKRKKIVDGENPQTKKHENGRRWTVKVIVDGKPISKTQKPGI
jgi:hypothetical protein